MSDDDTKGKKKILHIIVTAAATCIITMLVTDLYSAGKQSLTSVIKGQTVGILKTGMSLEVTPVGRYYLDGRILFIGKERRVTKYSIKVINHNLHCNDKVKLAIGHKSSDILYVRCPSVISAKTMSGADATDLELNENVKDVLVIFDCPPPGSETILEIGITGTNDYPQDDMVYGALYHRDGLEAAKVISVIWR